ncbi:hypothetical protein MBLNU457_g0746t1 [Dothideomycetes sp. NU457]
MGHASSKDDFSAEYVHVNSIKHPRCKCLDCSCACKAFNTLDMEPDTGQLADRDCPDLDSLMTDTSSEASYDEEDDGVSLPRSSSCQQLHHFLNAANIGNDLEDHINAPHRRPSSLSMDVLMASNSSLADSMSPQPYSPLSASASLFGMGGQFRYDPSSGASSTYLTAASHLSTDPFAATEVDYDGTVLVAASSEEGTKVAMHSYVFRPLRLVPENDFW